MRSLFLNRRHSRVSWRSQHSQTRLGPIEYYEEEETESPREEYAQLLDEAEEPTGMNSVKMDKSVSNKTYSTDNIAGIVSWICVGVGLVVVAVMLISTKASGRRGV